MALATAAIQVEGLKELGETLRNLDAKLVKKVVRKGLRAGAKVVLAEVRASAPKRTGRMAKAFQITGGGRGVKRGQVGLRLQVGKKWFVGDQFYAGFQEFGWVPGQRGHRLEARAKRYARELERESRLARRRGGGLAAKGTNQRARQDQFFAAEGRRRAVAEGGDRAKIPGRHFVERAAKAKAQAAVAAIVETIRAEIDRAVNDAKKGTP